MGVFSFLFWVKGSCECFLFYFGSWVVWFSLQGCCEGPKVVTNILLTCMGQQHGQNTRNKILFSFSLQCGCGDSKKLQSTHLHGCAHMCRKLEVFLGLNFISFFMYSLLSFHVILFLKYFFFVVWRDDRVTYLVQIELVFCIEIYKGFNFLT